MTTRRSTHFVVSLPPTVVKRLRSRGARPDQRHGPYNYSAQLTRVFALYDSAVVRSDPRETRGLPQEHYELVLDLLPDPATLEASRIHELGDVVGEDVTFVDRALAVGLDPEEFVETINGYSFAEKLHLVDAAQVRQAAGAGKGRAR